MSDIARATLKRNGIVVIDIFEPKAPDPRNDRSRGATLRYLLSIPGP